jgi:membrane protease YdiL (CAAX protease family)
MSLLEQPRVTPLLLVMVYVTQIMLSMFFTSKWFPVDTLTELQRATGSWITVTLMASSAFGGIGVLAISRFGRLSLRQIGWRAEWLPAALITTFCLWLFLNVYAANNPLASTEVVRSPLDAGVGRVFGPLIAQLLGTGLMEETLYRAVLWPQIALLLVGRMRPMTAIVASLMLSQIIFSLAHLPILIYRDMPLDQMGGTLLMLFAAGLALAVIYVTTGNLLIAVGIHALGNTPALIVPDAPHVGSLTLAVSVVI